MMCNSWTTHAGFQHTSHSVLRISLITWQAIRKTLKVSLDYKLNKQAILKYNCMCCTDFTQLTIEELKKETKVADQQLDTGIERTDLPVLASYFDNINDGYLEAMNLSPGQQTDVRKKENVGGTLAGMILALTLWLNSQLRGTFRALIVILLSLGKILVAAQVFKYLSKKGNNHILYYLWLDLDNTVYHISVFLYFLDFTPPLPTCQERNTKLSLYKEYLQSLYKILTPSSTRQWPPVSTNKVFKLAMIQKEKIQRGKMDDEFVRLTITGKIDDILLKKKPVQLKDIFFNTKDGQRFVLIEGAPGSGKSTLALHICKEWAEGKLFQEFDIAILVRLRDPQIRHLNLTIEKLLPRRNSVMGSEIGAEILKTDGKGVLWVLDGWDELPADLPQNSIIKKLIEPGMSQESPLHESTVIVTSRPSSSAELQPLVSSRVEVLGFTPKELKQYFTECLNDDSQAVQTLLNRLQENPAVESSCYLPLNASIVVNCFLCENHSLPKNNHEIFKSVVQSSLKRYIQDRLRKTTPVGNITSPDSLPSEVRTPFLQMCQQAYQGIKQNKVTFTNKDFSITEGISNIGLLQSVPSILGDNQLVYYCFLHLSIQELLAAIHISLMSSEDQISVFEKLFGQPRFGAVFQFYAGITKLLATRQLLSKIVKSKYLLLLSVMHCLYEAEDSSLCAFVADLLDNRLNLCNITMNPIDCLSVGYFASFTTKPFSLDLTGCSIGDQGCKFLTRGLSKNPHSHCNIQLDLSKNEIHCEGIQYIAELLIAKPTLLSKIELSCNEIGENGLNILCEAFSVHTLLTHLYLCQCSLTFNEYRAISGILETNTSLQYLDLSYNRIGNPELSNLCEALSTNISLKTLDLNYCSLTISDDNGAALCQLLSKNNSLKFLNLSRNTITSCRKIAAGLAVNKTLKTLLLVSCKLTDRNIEELLMGLINNIEELNIYDNDSITENVTEMLIRHLATHCPKLNKLVTPIHLFSYIRSVFLYGDINEERKRNGLTYISL